MIEINDNTEFVGVWFANLPEDDGDFMAAVFRKRGESKWQIRYRFRYYADKRAHDSDDRKSWWSGSFDGDAAKAKAAVENMCAVIGMRRRDFVDMAGAKTAREMLELLAARPWAHLQTEGAKGQA